MKLLSAGFAVPRQGLTIPLMKDSAKPEQNGNSSSDWQSNLKRIMIHSPNYGFQVIEGEEDLPLQFFRRYGHPVRNRLREIMQICIMISFTFVFPTGLLLSIIWMPSPLQFWWLSYQLYTVLTMYWYRYGGGTNWSTTAARLASHLAEAESNSKLPIYLATGETGKALEISLCTTFHDGFASARKHALELLQFENGPLDPGAAK